LNTADASSAVASGSGGATGMQQPLMRSVAIGSWPRTDAVFMRSFYALTIVDAKT